MSDNSSRSNPQMEVITYSEAQLRDCLNRLQEKLLSRAKSNPMIYNQLVDMTSFLEIFTDETHEDYFDYINEDILPDEFNTEIFGENPHKMLSTWGNEILREISGVITTIWWEDNGPQDPNDQEGYGGTASLIRKKTKYTNISEFGKNPNISEFGKKSIDRIMATKKWYLYLINQRIFKRKNINKTKKSKSQRSRSKRTKGSKSQRSMSKRTKGSKSQRSRSQRSRSQRSNSQN